MKFPLLLSPLPPLKNPIWLNEVAKTIWCHWQLLKVLKKYLGIVAWAIQITSFGKVHYSNSNYELLHQAGRGREGSDPCLLDVFGNGKSISLLWSHSTILSSSYLEEGITEFVYLLVSSIEIPGKYVQDCSSISSIKQVVQHYKSFNKIKFIQISSKSNGAFFNRSATLKNSKHSVLR